MDIASKKIRYSMIKAGCSSEKQGPTAGQHTPLLFIDVLGEDHSSIGKLSLSLFASSSGM